jgi:transmembrane sensor
VLGIVAAKYVGSSDTRTYATDLGGRETLALSDGSRIELNTNTVLRVAAKGRNRTVWLDKGEAYFEIKHDAAHPFVVFAAGHRITDLGTKFLVRQNSNRIEVALIEGKARLDSSDAAKAQSAVLTPGEVAVATVDRISVKRKPASALRDELGWQRGILVFRASTLAEVAAEYNRYNARKIVIADDATAARTMSATLPANDLDTFARIARNFLGLHVRETKDEIVISQ